MCSLKAQIDIFPGNQHSSITRRDISIRMNSNQPVICLDDDISETGNVEPIASHHTKNVDGDPPGGY